VLDIHDLNIRFATKKGALHAVKNLDLQLYKGEILAIVGESGSGKSVSAYAILGLLPAHAEVNYDAISFRGRSLATCTPACAT